MRSTDSINALRGIAFVCVAIGLMSAQDAALKWLAGAYATMQILLVRGVVVVSVAAIVVKVDGGIERLRTSRPWAHAIRCVLNVSTVALFIAALARLPLAEVMAIVMAAPLFTLVLTTLILGERVDWQRWVACLVGFLGVLIMLRPSGNAFNLGGAFAIAASLSYSFIVIQTRHLTSTESDASMLLYPSATVLLLGLIIAPFQWRPLAVEDAALMAGAGLAMGIAHYCLVQAYRHASPGVLAPFDFTALPWGLVLGWLIWKEVPDAVTLGGAGLVAAAGLYVLRRETRAKS